MQRGTQRGMDCRTVQSRKVAETLYIDDAIRAGLEERDLGEG